MRKAQIKVGDRLALCSPGWNRDHFYGEQVEVLETGDRTVVPSYVWNRGSFIGTRVRTAGGNVEKVVNNVELWMPWADYVAAKAEYDKAQAETQARRDEWQRGRNLENVEIAEALARVDMPHRGDVDLDKNHVALLALARVVNSA